MVVITLLLTTLPACAASVGPYVYVADSNIADSALDSIFVIDPASNAVIKSFPGGVMPRDVVVTHDGTKAYVLGGSGVITVVNTEAEEVIGTISVGASPYDLSLSPDGTKVYVADYAGDRVYLINTATDVVAFLPVGDGPGDIVMSPDGRRVYVANREDSTISIINTEYGPEPSDYLISTTVTMDITPDRLAITPDGSRVFVVDYRGLIQIYDTLSCTFSSPVWVGKTIRDIAITPDGNKAYLVEPDINSVEVLDTSSCTSLRPITVGYDPRSVAITPDGTRAYVTNMDSGSLSVISTDSDSVVETISIALWAPWSPWAAPAGLWISRSIPEVTLTCSPSPSVYGQFVTYTATVTGTGSTPTGMVIFKDGRTAIGGNIVNGAGQSTITTWSLSAGTHQITALYQGDSLYGTATSPAFTQTVDRADAVMALTSSDNPTVYGQPVTFAATVSAVAPSFIGPAGTVTFIVDGTPTEPVWLSSGVATYTTSSLSVGSHTITATYTDVEGNYNGCSGSLTGGPLVVTKADSAPGLTSTPNPSVYGQSVTLTATVSAAAPGAGTPTGTVTFYDGEVAIGPAVTLAGGVATLTTSSLSTGTHSFRVVYSGDGSFNGATSPAATHEVNKAATTTALISATNPSVYGQSVTFTATVSPVAPGAGTPTGTVTFYDDGTPIGTAVPLGAEGATLTTGTLSAGSHTITATYGGDANFNGATSPAVTQTVNKADTTLGLVSSVNPSMYGQPVTFTATVSTVAPGSGTPAGTVEFFSDGSSIGTAVVSGTGVATLTTSTLSVSSHTIRATYGGNSNYNGCTGTLAETVNKANTIQTVTSSADPGVFGQPITFTATVSAEAPGSGTPAGTITFFDATTNLGTATLSGGVATFTTSTLSVASHTITTSYSGDDHFNGCTGSLAGNPQLVDRADTALALTSSLNPSVYGQPVTLTATVSVEAPGSGTPTGTVAFYDDGSLIGTATLSGAGVAALTTGALPVDSHTITASYNGDSHFKECTGSLAGNPQVVNKANTVIGLTEDTNPTVYGQPITFTATVSTVAPGAGVPTGTVTFLDDGSTIGTATVSGAGVATLITSTLPAGSHTITASYAGDGSFNGCAGSLSGAQVVDKADTTQTLASSVNPSVYGQPVTFTATVTAIAPGAGTPTGTVEFLDGGSIIGTATLSAGGVATLTTAGLSSGSHAVTTNFAGDSNFNGCTGSLIGDPQIVNAASSAVALAALPNPDWICQPVTFTATVTGTYGTPTGIVTFLDGGSSLGTATISGGTATFTTSGLSVGTHTITAAYPGDTNYLSSTSSGLSEVILPNPPVADFTANLSSGVSPVTIRFTDTSLGSPISWAWNFGDGSANSTEQNPAHSYTSPGTYTVTLTVANAGGSTSLQRSGLILVRAPASGAPLTISMDQMYSRLTGLLVPSPSPLPSSTPVPVPTAQAVAGTNATPIPAPSSVVTPSVTPEAATGSPVGIPILLVVGVLVVVITAATVTYLWVTRK